MVAQKKRAYHTPGIIMDTSRTDDEPADRDREPLVPGAVVEDMFAAI